MKAKTFIKNIRMEMTILLVRVNFGRLDKVSLQELTEIWNRCWQGYYYEMTFTQEQMQVWLDLGAVSLEHSLALVREDEVIGFALLAREREQAWIAGTSIAPKVRGQGLFASLMQAQLDVARQLGLKDVFLEVLSQNHARKVYQAVGFQKLRQLNLYRVDAEERLKLKSHTAFEFGLSKEWEDMEAYRLFRQTSLAAYFNARSWGSCKPAWQRREAYLSRQRNLTAMLSRGDTAGFLLAGEERRIVLDAWSSGPRDSLELLSEILTRTGKIVLTNQPEDWLSASLAACQIKPQEVQIEMRCNLR